MIDMRQILPNLAPVNADERLDAIGHHIQDHLRQQPDKTAIIDGDRSMTWADLLNRTNRIANRLREQGLTPRGRLAKSSVVPAR